MNLSDEVYTGAIHISGTVHAGPALTLFAGRGPELGSRGRRRGSPSVYIILWDVARVCARRGFYGVTF